MTETKLEVAKKILVIDDEASVSRFVRHGLEAQGFQVTEAETGKDGLSRMIDVKPDLVILDFGLPDMTGLQVLQKLREWSKIPVIFLTVRDSDEDKVAALDQGADDYLTKPFSFPELLARVRVALRHAQGASPTEPIFINGKLQIDRSAHVVTYDGKQVHLTSTEYDLLQLLAQHAGKVVPHRTILKEIWGPNSIEHNHYLRVYFGQIRKKLEAIEENSSSMIETEAGVGYRLKR